SMAGTAHKNKDTEAKKSVVANPAFQTTQLSAFSASLRPRLFPGPHSTHQFSDLLSVPNQSNQNAEDAETPRTQRLDLHYFPRTDRLKLNEHLCYIRFD